MIQLNGKNASKSPEVLDVIAQIKVLILDMQKEKDNAIQRNAELSNRKEKLEQEVQDLKKIISNANKSTDESQNEHEESRK